MSHQLGTTLGTKSLHLVNLIFPILYFGILVRVIMTNYSNVPYWDEWDSRLIMNPKLGDLTAGTLWQQHNEHRIVWSKILFYLDFQFFNGNSAPLLISGLIIVMITFSLFIFYIWGLSSIRKISINDSFTLTAVIGILLFSTMQSENFFWAFQSQFFLAILLPLTTLLLGFRYIQTNNNKFFIFCWVASFSSMGTVASGLLISLCIVLMNILSRLEKRVILTSIGLAVIEFFLYFYRYKTPNSSPVSVAIHHPVFILKYVVHYLSFPTTYLVSGNNPAFSFLAALIYLSVVCVSLTRIYIKRDIINNSVLVPAIMGIYVLTTATISAGGRYQFGLAQSTASRYTTMSLVGWCCIAILCFELFKKRDSIWFMFIPILLGVLLLPQQTKGLSIQDNQLFDRKLAAIALELNIDDQATLGNIYPNATRVLSLSKVLINNHQSIFGDPIVFGAKALIGRHIDLRTVGTCIGHVDTNTPIAGQTSWRQISGWLYDSKFHRIPKIALEVDSTGMVIGYGLSGMLRPDVANAIDKHAKFSGYALYSNSQSIFEIVGYDESPICSSKS